MVANLKIWWISHFVVFSVIFFFLIGLIGLVIVLIMDKSNEKGDNTRVNFSYKYIQVNRKTNRTTSGFVTLATPINEEKGYRSYEENNGNLHLISKNGLNQYTCTGSCHCDDVKKRRNGVSITLSKGLMYLVAAASTVIAHNLAMKKFQEECNDEYEGICGFDLIKADIEECYPEEYEKPRGEVDMRKYLCKGNCITRKFRKTEVMDLAYKEMCEDYYNEGVVDVDCAKSEYDCRVDAAFEFLQFFLTGYCRLFSRTNIKDWYGLVPLCKAEDDGNNPTIMCKQIEGTKGPAGDKWGFMG